MKKQILLNVAVAAALFSTNVEAQSNRAFAITGQTLGSYHWNTIREIDLSTGEVIRTVYDPQNSVQPYDALTKGAINLTAFEKSSLKGQPTATGVAAASFDARHNRLYFTNMRGDELRYFDMGSNEAKVYYVQGVSLAGGNKYDEANVITRMAFASDGYGYALTNDGNNLIRFTTDQKPVVTKMGELIDGKKNGGLSVHNLCAGWGGDMVGDAYGNLYMVTMKNNIFKINPQTRVADYVGAVSGLPEGFTSNGVAVNADGDLILSCATLTNNYFKVNIATLAATVVQKKGEFVYNASDLANGNLLYQKSVLANKFVVEEVKGNDAVSVYPNPVFNKTFTVQFDKVMAGRYNLQLTDASGRNVMTKTLVINGAGQVEKINLSRTAAGGMYLLKLTGSNKQVVYSDKIVVQ